MSFLIYLFKSIYSAYGWGIWASLLLLQKHSTKSLILVLKIRDELKPSSTKQMDSFEVQTNSGVPAPVLQPRLEVCRKAELIVDRATARGDLTSRFVSLSLLWSMIRVVAVVTS